MGWKKHESRVNLNSVNSPALIIPYVVSLVILIFISVYFYQRRNQSKEVNSLFFLSLGVILWIGTYVFAQLSEGQTQDFWYQWMRLGIIFTSFMIFIFSMRHTHNVRFFQKGYLLLAIPTLLVIILLLVNAIERHAISGRSIIQQGEMDWVVFLALGYVFLISLASVVILVKAYFEGPSTLRWQGLAMAIGILLPVTISLETDILGQDWIPNFDASTFSVVFSVLIFAWIVSRRQLLNFWPVAYETILHNIHDGVIILNLDGQVIMINPTGEAVLGQASKNVLGKSFGELMARLGVGEIPLEGLQEEPVEFSPQGNSQVTYHIRITAMRDKNRECKGSVVLIYDISEWKRSQKQLTDLATIDYLTGNYNRQHFIHLAHAELLRCANNRKPCSIILLDLDHFKIVNDNYGHQVGDQVLKHVVDLCRDNIRRMDILGRYGGDEFIILLPEIPLADVMPVAERMRLAVDQSAFTTSQSIIPITVSLGVVVADADAPIPLDRLLEQADQALYVAKNEGRNRISVYSNQE